MIIIAGPCQLETKEHALQIAYTMKKICNDNGGSTRRAIIGLFEKE